MSVREDNARRLAAQITGRKGTVWQPVVGRRPFFGTWSDYVIVAGDEVLSPCPVHGMTPWTPGRGFTYPVVFSTAAMPPKITTSCGCRPADVVSGLGLLDRWAAMASETA